MSRKSLLSTVPVVAFAAAALIVGPAHLGGRALAKIRKSGVASEPLTLVTLKDARHPQAVCNDGSPAALYFQAGHGSDRNKWVIHFQGGGGCATDHDCLARAKDDPNLVSSSKLPRTLRSDGILSTAKSVNPDFADYTHVLVHYCSSDSYAGDGERNIGGSTWRFRGHKIVDAVIDKLEAGAASGAPSLAKASDVLVTGSSAGSFGVHNNLDRIAARLSGARVVGILDSGWKPPIDPFGPGTLQVAPGAPEAMTYASAIPDESCAAANPGKEGACLYQSFVFPYLTTPVFVYAEQRDPVLLGTLGITPPLKSADQRQYVLKYGKLLRQSVQQEKVPAYFLADVGQHTSLANDRFTSVVIDGQTLAETIGDWYFGRPGQLQLIQKPQGRSGANGAQGQQRPRRKQL